MYKLYADNIITKGCARDLLIDFGRNKITLIPKEVTTLIESVGKQHVLTSEDDLELISELIQQEIIFEINEFENDFFPDLDLAFDYPAAITNAVIEISLLNIQFIEETFNQLEELNCFYYFIAIIDNFTSKDIKKIETTINETSIHGFELAANYFSNSVLLDFIDNCIENPRLHGKIRVYNCHDELFKEKLSDRVIFCEGIFDPKNCGNIKQQNFNINLQIYTESQQFNTCLNRKVSVDREGNIRNCLAMRESFGNIQKDKIGKVALNPQFNKFSHIKKDNISKCKDCEFRHICTDCRAFTEDPSDVYSKPLKCGYNPYTNIWEEWSTNPLKQKAIDFYGLRKLLKKKEA